MYLTVLLCKLKEVTCGKHIIYIHTHFRAYLRHFYWCSRTVKRGRKSWEWGNRRARELRKENVQILDKRKKVTCSYNISIFFKWYISEKIIKESYRTKFQFNEYEFKWKREKEGQKETTATQGQSPTTVHKGHSQPLHDVFRPTARGTGAKSCRRFTSEKEEERTDREEISRSM